MMLVRRIPVVRVMIIELLESTDIYASRQLTQEKVVNVVDTNSAKKEATSNLNQHQPLLSLVLTHAWTEPAH